MMVVSPRIRGRKPSEDGYMLLAAMFMLALIVISLAVAAPEVAKSIQRDRDLETMHRGQQYARAIQLYYRQFHAYPPNVDALVKTNNVRFLRKKYLDPITGKDDWKPILFGQNKTPLAMGFFGQPLGGLDGSQPMAGTGPAGGNTQQNGPLGGGSSTIGGAGLNMPGNNIFGGASQPTGPTGTAPVSGGTDANGNPTAGGGGSTGASGSTGSTGSSFMSGQNSQTFGGAGIVGFEPASPKQSILIFKKKNHYNQWEFTYSPLIEMQQQGAAGGNLMPGNGNNGQSGTPGFGGTSGSPGFGSPSGSPGFGGTGGGTSFGGGSFGNSGGGFGSGPSSPAPTQPQQ